MHAWVPEHSGGFLPCSIGTVERCAPKMSPPLSFTAVLAANLLVPAIGLDNGLALRPPMGFRTWNQFGLNVNSSLMTTVFEALARADREVDGKPTSLVDLGYVRAGIDDGWQLCGSGPTGTGFHNRSGYPIVDRVKFPDMRALTAAARRLGVIPGWCVLFLLVPLFQSVYF